MWYDVRTDNMALSFSTAVKAYQDEIKNLPFVPKGSFGGNVVGADGLPTKFFFLGGGVVLVFGP